MDERTKILIKIEKLEGHLGESICYDRSGSIEELQLACSRLEYRYKKKCEENKVAELLLMSAAIADVMEDKYGLVSSFLKALVTPLSNESNPSQEKDT